MFVWGAYSCQAQHIPRLIRQKVTNRYSRQETNIRSMLEIDGYYSELKKTTQPGTSNNTIIFYEDGTFLYNISINNLRHSSNMSLYLDEISNSINKNPFHSSGDWGVYKTKNDTLVLQYIHKKRSLNDNWFGFELWYKIVDRNSIVLISSMTKPLHQELKQGKNHETYLKKINKDEYVLPATFISHKNLPLPDSWLKKEDWIWCKDNAD